MEKKLSGHCLVCGTVLTGLLGKLFRLFGIRRSGRNPNICTRCDFHIAEGRVVELSVLFADLTGFTNLTNRLGAVRRVFPLRLQLLGRRDPRGQWAH